MSARPELRVLGEILLAHPELEDLVVRACAHAAYETWRAVVAERRFATFGISASSGARLEPAWCELSEAIAGRWSDWARSLVRRGEERPIVADLLFNTDEQVMVDAMLFGAVASVAATILMIAAPPAEREAVRRRIVEAVTASVAPSPGGASSGGDADVEHEF